MGILSKMLSQEAENAPEVEMVQPIDLTDQPAPAPVSGCVVAGFAPLPSGFSILAVQEPDQIDQTSPDGRTIPGAIHYADGLSQFERRQAKAAFDWNRSFPMEG